MSTFELGEVLSDLRGALRPLVPAGVQLTFKAPGSLSLESDRVLLAQVLRNLLTNALKFTANGRVELTCSQPNDYEVVIEVNDTGIGIAEVDVDRVFEEFYQVRSPLQAAVRGTGLGLPYAKRVAEVLGGTLTVRSRLGHGSTFSVTLPRAWVSARFGKAATGSQNVAINCALIIDDDAGFRIALRGMLQGVANRVDEADGGSEGIAKMHELQPDIVFLDLRMPDMSGADVFAQARKEPRLRDIPIVVVTSAQTMGEQAIGTPVMAKSSMTRERVLQIVRDACEASEGSQS